MHTIIRVEHGQSGTIAHSYDDLCTLRDTLRAARRIALGDEAPPDWLDRGVGTILALWTGTPVLCRIPGVQCVVLASAADAACFPNTLATLPTD